MVDSKKEILNSEIKSRLDQIFSEGEEPEGISTSSSLSAPPPAASPIDRLKAFILSLEWEITDPVLTDTASEIDYLLERFSGDKMLTLLLQIQKAAVKYIQAHKAKAHPDAINLIQSAFLQFEHLFTAPSLTASEKKKAVSEELAKLKSLKQKIQAGKPASAAQVSPAEMARLTKEIGSLKAMIQSELDALRKDIKAWLNKTD